MTENAIGVCGVNIRFLYPLRFVLINQFFTDTVCRYLQGARDTFHTSWKGDARSYCRNPAIHTSIDIEALDAQRKYFSRQIEIPSLDLETHSDDAGREND